MSIDFMQACRKDTTYPLLNAKRAIELLTTGAVEGKIVLTIA